MAKSQLSWIDIAFIPSLRLLLSRYALRRRIKSLTNSSCHVACLDSLLSQHV
jgi:hypothetical protein